MQKIILSALLTLLLASNVWAKPMNILFQGVEYKKIATSLFMLTSAGGGILVCRSKAQAETIASIHYGTVLKLITHNGYLKYANQEVKIPWKGNKFYGVIVE